LSYSGKRHLTFLTHVTQEEVEKISSWIKYANRIISDHFGITTTFDVLICKGKWEMEVQTISRKYLSGQSIYDDIKFVGITDYHLEEIVIRYDIARFGHYLHELIHGIVSRNHPHQLREGLAWYFTLKLSQGFKYVRPPYSSWVDDLYVYQVNQLSEIVGEEFLKDLTIGNATFQYDFLPKDVQDLFAPEEVFYSKKRHHR